MMTGGKMKEKGIRRGRKRREVRNDEEEKRKRKE